MRSLRLVVLFCCLPLLAVAAGDAPASTTLEPASLRPARWSGAAARALSQSEEGEWNAVLATLPVSPSEVRERYLRAEALVLSGKHADAVVEVAGLAGRAPGLAPRLGCLGARSAMALEDWAKADRFLRDCVSDPIFGKGARVDRLLVEGRTSDARAAAVRLESLAGEGGALRDDALLAAATLLDETGRSTEALELLRRIFLDDPVAPLAPKALDRAKGIVTRLKLPPPPEARLLARAEKLLEAGQPKAARDQLSDLRFASVCSGASCSVPSCGMPERAPESDDKKPPTSPPAPASEPFALTAAVDDETPSSLPSLPACAVRNVASPAPALACRAQLLEAQLARKAKEHERAIRLGLEVYGRCADEAVRAKAVTVAAMSAASLKKPLALPLLQLAALQFGAHGLADDALLSWASRAREEGHGALERALLRRLVQSHPDSDQRAEALF
ncbi:MAG: hypothetical protein RL199_2315, partial [Pseudomonadota bacterium]